MLVLVLLLLLLLLQLLVFDFVFDAVFVAVILLQRLRCGVVLFVSTHDDCWIDAFAFVYDEERPR